MFDTQSAGLDKATLAGKVNGRLIDRCLPRPKILKQWTSPATRAHLTGPVIADGFFSDIVFERPFTP